VTLVLTVATPVYALHVSDRLVSKAGVRYDPLANKTVVLRATDGLLAFGYTGPARVGGMPTDTWIAEAVAGEPCAGDAGGGMRMGTFPVRDVGTTLLELCQRLRLNGQFRSLNGEITAVGWQWNGRRERALVRQVLWVLHRGSGELRWEQLVPRHIPERKKVFRMIATGDWPLGAEAWQGLVNQVGAARRDVDRVESALAEAIRNASVVRRGTIGTHCMSVLLRPWQHPQALVRFLPCAAHEAEAFGQVVEVAYSPWMVAPDAIHAPAVHIGGWTCAQGLLTYEMTSPSTPDDQRLKAAFQAQLRRPA
jgi:hypothetical protein